MPNLSDYDEDDEEFDVEETEDDDLSEYTEETIQAAKKRQAAQDAGWSVSDIAQFMAYTPTIVEAIKDGAFDGPEIKAIITACMHRRETVMGKPKPPGTASHNARGKGPRRRVQATGAVNHDKGTDRYSGPVLGEGGLLLNAIHAYHTPSRDKFVVSGRAYAKADMKGKVLRLPDRFDPFYLGKQLVRIRDVRLKGIEVELVENPEFVHPNSTELKKEKFRPGYTFDVTAMDVEHIFG